MSDAHNCRLFNAPLLGNAVARQRTLPWQPHHRGHIGNVVECDHPSFVPVGPFVDELWHFQYFPTWRPAAILNFKKLIFDHVTVIAVLIYCCLPNFIKIGSRVWPPYAHNCWMFNAPLLGNAVARQRTLPWQPHHGGHVGGMMGCDHPSWVSVGPLVSELWHF